MSTQIISKKSPRIDGNGQPLLKISANTIFLACNFEDKRVKRHFDRLKKKWEENLPVRVYLSDQVQGGGARDLWKEITETIEEANLAIFDVTSFRPNVILELGFALAHKQPNQIIICRDLTPSGKESAKRRKWLLSDISHLHRIEYKTFDILDKQLIKHVERMTPVDNFYRLMKEIERQKNLSAQLYVIEALEALIELRDYEPPQRQEFRSRLEDRGVDAKTIENLLQRFKLAKPEPGRNGRWMLID
jgi:nucleoside 2-deoxyribosyltransferase